MEVIEYEFENLPVLPFSVYIVSQDGEILPKEMYTVTRKRKAGIKIGFEVYICEIGKYMDWEEYRFVPVFNFSVNDNREQYRYSSTRN